MPTWHLIAAGMALVAGPLAAQTAPAVYDTQSQPLEIDDSTQADQIDLVDDGNERMTVPVRIGGREYKFLVDTGADRTAVSQEMAKDQNLRPGPNARLHSISGESSVRTAAVPLIELSRRAIRDIEAPLLQRALMGADGILGVDSLRGQRVMFDFKADTMAVVPSSKSIESRAQPGEIVVRARLKNGRLIMTKATVDGQSVDVVLDTGSQISMANMALYRRLRGRGALKSLGTVDLQSVTGQSISGEYTILNKLEVSGMTIERLSVAFADAHTFKQIGLLKRPAILLGMNGMRAFERVSIDFARRKLRVLLRDRSDAGDAVMVLKGKVSPAGFEPATY